MSPRDPRPALPGYLMFAAGVDLSLSLLLCLAVAAVIYRDQIYWQFASDPRSLALLAGILGVPVLLGAALAWRGMRKRGHVMTLARGIALASLVLVSTAALFFGAWIGIYQPGDPKNLAYLLWKHGLYSIDPKEAVNSVAEDPERASILLGRTREDLRRTFGGLVPLKQAPPYLQWCVASSAWRNRDVSFLPDSNLMIAFEHGKSVDFTLAKGC